MLTSAADSFMNPTNGKARADFGSFIPFYV